MRRNFSKKVISSLLLGSTFLAMFGCETAKKAPDSVSCPAEVSSVAAYTHDTPASEQEIDELVDSGIGSDIREFSAEMFKLEYEKSEKGENVFLSPMSVYTALAMLENGADGETLSELDSVLRRYSNTSQSDIDIARELSTDDLNSYFKNYIDGLGGETAELSIANSVWVMKRDDVKMNEDFLSSVSDFYSAEIFNDEPNEKAVDNINSWVGRNTHDMIKSILNPGDITPDTISVLLNAVAFEGKWENPYNEYSVQKDIFTNYDKSEVEIDFMNSTEDYYIDDNGRAKGFVKYYGNNSGKTYCFIALLPDEKIGIDKYVSEYFTADTIKNCYDNAVEASVQAGLPKFKFETKYKLNSTLYDMGIKRAFDAEEADFSRLAESESGNIFVSKVAHKAYIEVDEEGTKAAAATAIVVEYNGAVFAEDYYEVYLDRPFVFAIYDCQEEIPVFIGTLLKGE